MSLVNIEDIVNRAESAVDIIAANIADKITTLNP